MKDKPKIDCFDRVLIGFMCILFLFGAFKLGISFMEYSAVEHGVGYYEVDKHGHTKFMWIKVDSGEENKADE